MNSDQPQLKKIVLTQLRRHDPKYFADAGPAQEAKTLALAMPALDDVIETVSRLSLQGVNRRGLVMAVRHRTADIAHVLHQASRTLYRRWESVTRRRIARGYSTDGDGSAPGRIRSMTRAVLEQLCVDAAPPTAATLAKLAERLVEQAVVEFDANAASLGRYVCATLARVGLLLQRASACLWTAALLKPPSMADTATVSPVTVHGPTMRKATQMDEDDDVDDEELEDNAEKYLTGIKEFAARLTALSLDPATMPVGRDAVEEAKALCVVRDFIVRRHAELRRWVHPQAAVVDTWSPHAEYGADLGEQLLLQTYGPAGPDAADPANWTWRGQDTADYIMGDLICHLRHAADALGMDFDAAEGLGAWHYGNEKKEDSEASADIA